MVGASCESGIGWDFDGRSMCCSQGLPQSSATVSVIWERAFLPTVDRSHSLDLLVRKRTQMKAQNENGGGRMVEKVALASGAALMALAGNTVAEAGIVASQSLPLRPSTALHNVVV